MTDRDVVERLRSKATDCHASEEALYLEAADEIERLRSSPDRGAIVEERLLRALAICELLANTPPEGWRSKEQIHASLAEFRALSSPPGRKPE